MNLSQFSHQAFQALVLARDTFWRYAVHHDAQAAQHRENGKLADHCQSISKAESNKGLGDRMHSVIQSFQPPVEQTQPSKPTMYKKPYSDFFDMQFPESELPDAIAQQCLLALNIDAYLESIGCVPRAAISDEIPLIDIPEERIEDLVFADGDISGTKPIAVSNADDLQVVRGDYLFRFNIRLALEKDGFDATRFNNCVADENCVKFRNQLDFNTIAAMVYFVTELSQAIIPDADLQPTLYSLYSDRFSPRCIQYFFNQTKDQPNRSVYMTAYIYRKKFLDDGEVPTQDSIYVPRIHIEGEKRYYWKNVINLK